MAGPGVNGLFATELVPFNISLGRELDAEEVKAGPGGIGLFATEEAMFAMLTRPGYVFHNSFD